MDQIEDLKRRRKEYYEKKVFKNETLKEIRISLYDEAIECVEQLNNNKEIDTMEKAAIQIRLNKVIELLSMLEKIENDIPTDNSSVDVNLESYIYQLTKEQEDDIFGLNEKFKTLISDLEITQIEYVKNQKDKYLNVIKQKHGIEKTTITNGTLLDNEDEQRLLEELIINLYDKQREYMGKLCRKEDKILERNLDRYKETSELISILGNLSRPRGNINLEEYIVKLRTKRGVLKSYNFYIEKKIKYIPLSKNEQKDCDVIADLGKLIKILEDKQKNDEVTNLQKVEEVCKFLKDNALATLKRESSEKAIKGDDVDIDRLIKCLNLIYNSNFGINLPNVENISEIISLMENPNEESRKSHRIDYIENVKAMNLCLVLNLKRNRLLDNLIKKQNEEIDIINEVLSSQAKIGNVDFDSIMTHILNCNDLTEQLNIGRIYANRNAHFYGDVLNNPRNDILNFYHKYFMETNLPTMKIKDFLVGKEYANKDAEIDIEEALIRYFSDAILDKVQLDEETKPDFRKNLYGTEQPLDANTKKSLEEKLEEEYSINIKRLSQTISKSFKPKNSIGCLQNTIDSTKKSIKKCVEILLRVDNDQNLNSIERNLKKELVDNQIKPMIEKNAKPCFYLKQFYTKFFYYIYSERKR